MANIRFIVSLSRATERGVATGWRKGGTEVVGGDGKRGKGGKGGREQSRRQRFSIDGRLNNSKASCPAIFKRRAPTSACGRNPWSNSASPNKCILLMAGRGRRFYVSNRISASRLSSSTLGTGSSTVPISIFTSQVRLRLVGEKSKVRARTFSCELCVHARIFHVSTLRYSFAGKLPLNRAAEDTKFSRIVRRPFYFPRRASRQ